MIRSIAFALATLAVFVSVAPVRVLAAFDRAASDAKIRAVLDDWHAAAAAADEKRYFGHLAEESIFLGTDATERWTKAQFYAYAHPYFEKGKAWSFRAIRRDVIFSPDGKMAWFDEDLETGGLGPCRGSGVLVEANGAWKILHYNLALTVPNESLKAVMQAIAETKGKTPSK
jgi:ketosteroid isomerase-like protein